jgi:hypothetical protein
MLPIKNRRLRQRKENPKLRRKKKLHQKGIPNKQKKQQNKQQKEKPKKQPIKQQKQKISKNI